MGGLQLQLQERLQAEPYQMGVSATAPEPREMRSLEPFRPDGATKE
jgi:hypothetical protein